jgi:ribokinase
MKLFIVGSLNMDLTIRAAYMPKEGETMTGEGFLTTPGGKGANQAVAMGRLGGNALMVGMVGNTFATELLDSLRLSGVDTTFVGTCEDVSSGIAVIIVVDGNNRIILDRGSNDKVTKSLIDRALKTAKKGDYLVTQLEINLDMVEYALCEAKKKGLITVLNPAPAAPLTETILKNSDYFTPNQTEAEFYSGIYPKDEESAKACADVLIQKGVKNVLITMGEQGSVCISNGEYHKAEAVKVQAVDTTAAGDTYVGALVTRLSEGATIEQAMAFASRASSITVTRRGAQASIPYRSEVKD